LTNTQYRFILQYSVKIANYVNKVFKNVGGYANLISLLTYFTKIIVDPFKSSFRLDGANRNFSV